MVSTYAVVFYVRTEYLYLPKILTPGKSDISLTMFLRPSFLAVSFLINICDFKKFMMKMYLEILGVATQFIWSC